MTDERQQQEPLYSVSTDAAEKTDKNKTTSSSYIKKICHELHKYSGIWYMITANLIFATCIFTLKLIPADIFDIMIVRFFIQSVVFGLYAICYKHYNVFNTNGQPVACALNILTSCSTNLTYLAAFYFLPLSDLNTIKYTSIVWAALLAVIFLNERFKIVNGIALLLTIAGLILATKPQFFINTLSHIFNHSPTNTTIYNATTISTTTEAATSPYYYLGVGLAFVASLTKAIQFIARKQLIKTKQPYSVMNLQFTFSAFFVSCIYSIIRRFWQPGPYPWKWMGTVGVAFGCCQLLTNTFLAKALKRENVQLLSILDSFDIIYAVILQYIFFRQTKSWVFYLGALCIVTSAVILSVDRHLSNKRERKEKANNDKNDENNNNNV